MKKILFSVLTCLLPLSGVLGQKVPSGVKSASSAVCKIITYDTAGKLKSSSNGVFVSNGGVCVTDYKNLVGADSLVVMTKDGKKYQLKYVNGVDDIYDIARLTAIMKKSSFVQLSDAPVTVGTPVYVVMYSSSKTPSVVNGKVSEISSAKDGDKYYTLDIKLPESAVSCPVVSEDGKLIGIAQKSEEDGKAYACGVKMTEKMGFDAFMFTNLVASSVSLIKKLPATENDAQVALMMGISNIPESDYLKYLHQFMEMYPDSPYSYESLAKYYATKDQELADENIKEACQKYQKEDEQHYAMAKFIYTNLENMKGTKGYEVADAYREIDDAISINPLPLYYQLKGELEYSENKFSEAKESFGRVISSNLCTYPAVADYIELNRKCGADYDEQIMLVDSLMETKKDILGNDTLNLIYTKAVYLDGVGKYAEALRYLNIFSAGFNEKMSDEFFYYREQVAMRGKRYQQAMNDILKARELAPDNLVYMVEHAGLCIIAGNYNEALVLLGQCLAKEPDNVDINRLTGLAMLQVGRKEEACKHLKKASDAGDETAKRLLEMYCTEN